MSQEDNRQSPGWYPARLAVAMVAILGGTALGCVAIILVFPVALTVVLFLWFAVQGMMNDPDALAKVQAGAVATFLDGLRTLPLALPLIAWVGLLVWLFWRRVRSSGMDDSPHDGGDSR